MTYDLLQSHAVSHIHVIAANENFCHSYFCWIPSLLLLVEKQDENGSDGMRQQIRTEYTCVLQIKCTQMLGIKIHTKTEDYNSYV